MGFESLDEENLEAMNKGWNESEENYTRALCQLRQEGILVYGTFVFGYDNDTVETIDRALRFAMKEKLFIAAFNQLQPFPGTPIYQKMEKEQRLLDRAWWLKADYRFGDAVFMPNALSPSELGQGCMDARRKFFRFTSILSRALDFTGNCSSLFRALLFFQYNLLLGWEVEERRLLLRGQRG